MDQSTAAGTTMPDLLLPDVYVVADRVLIEKTPAGAWTVRDYGTRGVAEEVRAVLRGDGYSYPVLDVLGTFDRLDAAVRAARRAAR